MASLNINRWSFQLLRVALQSRQWSIWSPGNTVSSTLLLVVAPRVFRNTLNLTAHTAWKDATRLPQNRPLFSCSQSGEQGRRAIAPGWPDQNINNNGTCCPSLDERPFTQSSSGVDCSASPHTHGTRSLVPVCTHRERSCLSLASHSVRPGNFSGMRAVEPGAQRAGEMETDRWKTKR